MHTFRFKRAASTELWLEEVVAIDALTHSHFQRSVRDLRKCLAGFAACSAAEISSGKWGCGVFGGDPMHKFLQQAMCAQLTGKKLFLSSFRSEKEVQQFECLREMSRTHPVTFGWLLDRFQAFPRMQGKGFFTWLIKEWEKK